MGKVEEVLSSGGVDCRERPAVRGLAPFVVDKEAGRDGGCAAVEERDFGHGEVGEEDKRRPRDQARVEEIGPLLPRPRPGSLSQLIWLSGALS